MDVRVCDEDLQDSTLAQREKKVTVAGLLKAMFNSNTLNLSATEDFISRETLQF